MYRQLFNVKTTHKSTVTPAEKITLAWICNPSRWDYEVLFFFKNNNFLKISSLKQLRLGTRICPAALNKRSTGADDGIVVVQ